MKYRISEKIQKSLITPLTAPPSVGTGAGSDYETITRITTTLRDQEKSVEFFQICVITQPKAFFQSSLINLTLILELRYPSRDNVGHHCFRSHLQKGFVTFQSLLLLAQLLVTAPLT